MANKPISKAAQVRALREQRTESSGGGVESRPAARGSNAVQPLQRPGAGAYSSRTAGVAPGPSEAKPMKRGRPRIGEVREKPWLTAEPPMSERTWYRRQREQRK